MGDSVRRDPAVWIFSGIGVFVLILVFAGFFFARSGHAELLKVALVLTGIWAVVGVAFGLVRGVRSGRAAKSRSA